MNFSTALTAGGGRSTELCFWAVVSLNSGPFSCTIHALSSAQVLLVLAEKSTGEGGQCVGPAGACKEAASHERRLQKPPLCLPKLLATSWTPPKRALGSGDAQPLNIWRLGPLSAQISATTKRGCRPWAGPPCWGARKHGAGNPPPPVARCHAKQTRPTPGTPPPLVPSHICRPEERYAGPPPVAGLHNQGPP